MKKSTRFGFVLLPVLGALAMQAGAETYNIVSTVNTMTPIYVEGHENDPTQIEGFDYVYDLSIGGATVGNESGTIMFDSPPLNLADPVTMGSSTSTYTLTGIGSITAQCYGGVVTTESTATSGVVAMSSWCYLENGTGGLKGVAGTLSSYGTPNLLTLQGTLNETAVIPEGVQ